MSITVKHTPTSKKNYIQTLKMYCKTLSKSILNMNFKRKINLKSKKKVFGILEGPYISYRNLHRYICDRNDKNGIVAYPEVLSEKVNYAITSLNISMITTVE